MIKRITFATGAFALLSACASTPTLDGKWVLNGPTPRPSFVSSLIALDFHPGSTVTMTYSPAMPMFAPIAAGAGVKMELKPQIETDPYDDLGNGEIRITSKSKANTFCVDVKRDLLYLTPVAATRNSAIDAQIAAHETATVFRRAQ